MSQAKSADSTGGPTPAAEGLRFGLTARHRGPKVAAFVTFLAVLAMAAGLYSVVTWRLTMERRGVGGGRRAIDARAHRRHHEPHGALLGNR